MPGFGQIDASGTSANVPRVVAASDPSCGEDQGKEERSRTFSEGGHINLLRSPSHRTDSSSKQGSSTGRKSSDIHVIGAA